MTIDEEFAAFLEWMRTLNKDERRSVLGIIRDTFCRECGRKLPHTPLGLKRCGDGE